MTSQPSQGKLILLTGPSGVGKGTLVEELLKRHPEIWLSISATTRAPRTGEQDGKQYFFFNKDSFSELIENGGFLEWAEFAGNFYGTPRKPVEECLALGRKILLEIELEGARQVRKSFPNAFQVFLAPPSLIELERRIRGRDMDSEEAIQARLERAREEMDAKHEFDAIVVNDDLSLALKELEKFMGFESF